MKGLTKQNDRSLYDTDFDQWCEETAQAIRQGRFDRVDRENLAEEIESLAKRDRRELRSRTIVLIQHLHKWTWQPELREKSSWLATINEQRTQIELLLQDSPSLRRVIEEELETLRSKALRAAKAEIESKGKAEFEANSDKFKTLSGPASRFMRALLVRKFTVQQVLDPDYLPNSLDEHTKSVTPSDL